MLPILLGYGKYHLQISVEHEVVLLEWRCNSSFMDPQNSNMAQYDSRFIGLSKQQYNPKLCRFSKRQYDPSSNYSSWCKNKLFTFLFPWIRDLWCSYNLSYWRMDLLCFLKFSVALILIACLFDCFSLLLLQLYLNP